jgi:hypothetical protein
MVWESFTLTECVEFLQVSWCNSEPHRSSEVDVLFTDCDYANAIEPFYSANDCVNGSSNRYYLYLDPGTYIIPVSGGANYGPYVIDIITSIACPVPPPNDDCANAIPLICTSIVTANTISATSTGKPPACGTYYGNQTSGGVWYTFQGTGAVITASLCGSNFDTMIGIFTGSCGNFTCVAGNDDSCGLGSVVSWQSVQGTLYHIYVTGYGSSFGGDIELAISCSFPPNDDCANTVGGSLGANSTLSFAGTSTGATMTGVEVYFGVPVAWESFTLTACVQSLTINWCGSEPARTNMLPGLYYNCPTFSDGINAIGSDFLCINGSIRHFYTNIPAGTYYVPIPEGGGYGQGPYVMQVQTGNACPPPPANDLCADAVALICPSVVQGNTLYASNTGKPPGCEGYHGDQISRGVWYTFIGTGAVITASLCGSSYDSMIGIFTGSCGDFTCVAGNDDNQICAQHAIVDWQSVYGTTYHIYVTGYSAHAGDYQLTISCSFPSNDNCVNAQEITCGTLLNGTTATASNSSPPPACGSYWGNQASGGVWYRFVGTGAEVTASLCGSTFDTMIGIFTGTCGNYTCVAGNDDTHGECGLQSKVTWQSVVGANYIIYVTGYGVAQGQFQLQLTCTDNFVTVACKAILDGAWVPAQNLMRDDLRSGQLIPHGHPYGGIPFGHAGSETLGNAVLRVTGANAIVDWVLIELRNALAPAVVVGSRAALLQRDGDIVDTDGVSPVLFPQTVHGNYRVVVRHRNHLGILTSAPYFLDPTPTVIDLTVPATQIHGTNARTLNGGIMALWAGNANSDTILGYYGSGSDRQSILNTVGSSTPFSIIEPVYHPADVNMDGTVGYYGSGSDRQLLLNSIGSSTPFNIMEVPLE